MNQSNMFFSAQNRCHNLSYASYVENRYGFDGSFPGDLVTVDGHQAALIQVESKKMSCPAPRLKLTPIGRGEREIKRGKYTH